MHSPSLSNSQIQKYRITIENTGDKTFRLNPKLCEEEGYYYEPFSPVTGLTENTVSVSAPSTIPSKSKATLTVKINVPPTAKGILRGCIDLGMDDPGLDEWMQRVDINLRIYEKPTEPFVKTFAVENASKITVKVSGQSYSRSAERGCEFSVKIVSPDGVVSVKPSKLVESVGVTLLSGKLPPWEEAEGIYTITSYKKTKVYTIDNPVNGVWRVEVLPNCDSFDVEIEVE